MSLPRFFMRRLSTRWFNLYLMTCGLAFNLFAGFSVVQSLLKPQDHSAWQARRARMELEDYQVCSKHLFGQTLERGNDQKFSLKTKDGLVLSVPYRSLSTFGYTRDGERVEAVDAQFGSQTTAQASSTLFLITDDERKVQRCLPSYAAYRTQQLECVAASGEFSSNGECLLAVNQASDCQLMKGSLSEGNCRVPSSGHILRASGVLPAAKGGKCVALNCKSAADAAKHSKTR